MQHRLIMIDGITGSGKSSTAQYLARQLDLNGFQAVWHHEEEENHPLYYAEQDIETLHSQEDAYVFMENYPLLVEAFITNIFQQDDGIGRSFIIQGTPIYGMLGTRYVRK